MTVEEWDERYGSHEDAMWSGRVNGVLLTEIEGRAPGRALDVGCGEGADAIWLALQGWQVTAVDISRVAIDRAEAAAKEAGVQVEWVRADIVDRPPTPHAYDLVSVQYPALPRAHDDAVIGALLDAVAPGGSILFVGHADVDPDHAHAHGFDRADYVQPADVRACLDDTWSIAIDEERPRTVPAPPDTHHVNDTVLEARRRR